MNQDKVSAADQSAQADEQPITDEHGPALISSEQGGSPGARDEDASQRPANTQHRIDGVDGHESDDGARPPLRTADFDYELPQELIAQSPAAERDQCRLLIMDRRTGAYEDRRFCDIGEYLRPGDLLVANETRVRPSRLLGAKRGTGGAAEVFLLRETGGPEPRTNRIAYWEALVRPGKRLKPGGDAVVDFLDEFGNVAMSATVIDWVENGQRGERVIRLETQLASLDDALHAVGHTPLPPYIKDYHGDEELYQTVYSRHESSSAAPTAGLHFTQPLIQALQRQKVDWVTVELEVGLDTFRIVDEADPRAHTMHTELYTVPMRTVEAIRRTKEQGGRVIAVGTTSVRSLESAWDARSNQVLPKEREATSLYLLPGDQFHVVDGLITNFHVPRSTLMMLVSAFAGRDHIMNAYEHAKTAGYRFLSFGDAMFLTDMP